MQHFDLNTLIIETSQREHPYLEFLHVPAMSAGMYCLAAGATDSQQPHTEDELYVVMRGRATIHVGDEDTEVRAGSAIFVPAHVPHHFHSIVEDLAVLVLFAPAEYSQASAPASE